jgi:hypothetical protein
MFVLVDRAAPEVVAARVAAPLAASTGAVVVHMAIKVASSATRAALPAQ